MERIRRPGGRATHSLDTDEPCGKHVVRQALFFCSALRYERDVVASRQSGKQGPEALAGGGLAAARETRSHPQDV